MSSEEFPKVLHHPHYRKGKMTEVSGKDPISGKPFTDYNGEPDLFPDVTVNNGDQEAFYRAKGYLLHGEAPPPPADYAEYPMMLSHPGHKDAIPDDFDIRKDANGQVITTRIQGSPEAFPPVMVKDAAEEKKWAEKGYKRIGKADGDASQRAKASPFDPDYKMSEYPKFVDGKIVDPFAEISHNRYPMFVGDKLVNNRAEELMARGEAEVSTPAAVCIICGEDIMDDQDSQAGVAGPFHAFHTGALKAPATHDPAPIAIAVSGPKKRGRKPKTTVALDKVD